MVMCLKQILNQSRFTTITQNNFAKLKVNRCTDRKKKKKSVIRFFGSSPNKNSVWPQPTLTKTLDTLKEIKT